jgi:nucleoside-diphosphate-sugar epimerase
LESARNHGHVRRFVFASTGGAVYGEPAELPTSE